MISIFVAYITSFLHKSTDFPCHKYKGVIFHLSVYIDHKTSIVPHSPFGSHAEPAGNSDPSCPRPHDRRWGQTDPLSCGSHYRRPHRLSTAGGNSTCVHRYAGLCQGILQPHKCAAPWRNAVRETTWKKSVHSCGEGEILNWVFLIGSKLRVREIWEGLLLTQWKLELV